MKQYPFLILLMLSPLLAVSCAPQVPETIKGQENLVGVKPYPLDTCLVIDRKLASTPKTYTRVHKGQEVKFCCVNCVVAFEANPDPWIAKLNHVTR